MRITASPCQKKNNISVTVVSTRGSSDDHLAQIVPSEHPIESLKANLSANQRVCTNSIPLFEYPVPCRDGSLTYFKQLGFELDGAGGVVDGQGRQRVQLSSRCAVEHNRTRVRVRDVGG